MRKLKEKKYIALIIMVVLVLGIIAINRIGQIDKYANKIAVQKAYVDKINRLSANVVDSSNIINGYDEIEYVLKYTLENKENVKTRNVIIEATIDENDKYTTFKKITGEKVTSTLSNDKKKIQIRVEDAKVEKENTITIKMLVSGAPDGYKVTPTIQIKEETFEEYKSIQTDEIQVKTNSLIGQVRDENKTVVSNIELKLMKDKEEIKRTYTDEDGMYTFSDIQEGIYTVEVEEEVYEKTTESTIEIKDGQVLNIGVKSVKPYEIQLKKYITSLKIINNSKEEKYTYGEIEKVQQAIKNLKEIQGEITYKIVVKNIGKKEGIVTVVKDEIPEGLTFVESKNPDWELKDGKVYNESLEGISLKANEEREVTLILDIDKTKEAKTYINKVTTLGEVYEKVAYVLDGKTYKELEVLEGEKLEELKIENNNFDGWYTDKKYTNKYNFNNEVTKDLILYGKTKETHKVKFNDKDPETGKETPWDEQEIEDGKPAKEPEEPTHEGYDFKCWEDEDGNEWDFKTPVTKDLTLRTCYEKKEYTVEFYNYENKIEKEIKVKYKETIDTKQVPVLQEEGYTFTGWYELASEISFDFTTLITRNIKLYPKHKIIENAVIFNDENRITTVNVDYGKTVEPINSLGKYGYTFKHWSLEKDGEAFDFQTKIIKTTTLYAVYEINKYTVKFNDKDPETQEETPWDEQEIEHGKPAEEPEEPTHEGYKFKCWEDENGNEWDFETPVTKDLTLTTCYEKKEYTVKFMNEGNLYETQTVKYKEKAVKPTTEPSKVHNIFLGWTLNEELYSFDTLVTQDITLYSSYELVEKPTISHEPTEWTREKVVVTIGSNHPEYSYMYKIDENNYEKYTQPFEVYENSTVVAKSIKQEVESEIQTHEITNIDKIKPTITNFEESNIQISSFDIDVSAKDNESGLGQINVYKDEVLEVTKTYESDLNEEKNYTYSFNDLQENTTYKIKVEAIDKVGNISDVQEKEITTEEKEMVIVARIIGRENSLFQSEDLYENFPSLESAIKACPTGQCTIQMVLSTKESVEVLQGQDITLDLNGKNVVGVRDYTIQNSGNFIVVDKGEEQGKIQNNTGIALKNVENGTLQLGENEEELVVSVERPNIIGNTYGVYTEEDATFKFFDGRIEGIQAVYVKVDETPESYNATVNKNEEDKQVATLAQIVDPEARIGSQYYTKLQQAIDDSNIGFYEENNVTTNFLMGFESDGKYGFVYNEEDNTLVSNNNFTNTTAESYTIINLKGYNSNQILSITGYVDGVTGYDSSSNSSKIEIRENDSNGNELSPFINSTKFSTSSSTIKFILEKGKMYYVKLTNYNTGGSQKYSTDRKLVITDITLSNYKTGSLEIDSETGLVTAETINYSFNYDEQTGTLRSNNQYTSNTIASSYFEIDLTNESEDKELIVNATIDTINTSSYGNVFITEDANKRYYNYMSSGDDVVAYLSSYGGSGIGPRSYTKVLTHGKRYYLHIYYFKGYDTFPKEQYENRNSKDQFIINTIDVVPIMKSSTIDLKTELVTPGDYGFKESYGSFQNNNTSDDSQNTIAHSYIKIDLTRETMDKSVQVKLQVYMTLNFYAVVTNSPDLPENKESFIDSNNYPYSNYHDDYLYGKLKKGEVNYVHFVYKRGQETSYIYLYNVNLIDGIGLNLKNDLKTNENLGFTEWDYNYNSYYPKSSSEQSTADSYVKIDLTDAKTDQYAVIKAKFGYGRTPQYLYLTTGKDNVDYESINKNNSVLYYTSGEDTYNWSYASYKFTLTKGNVYYLHFANYNPSSSYEFALQSVVLVPMTTNLLNIGSLPVIKNDTINDYQKEIPTKDYEKINKSEKNYGFTYDDENNKFTNNNKGIPNSLAAAYVKIDLTEEQQDRTIKIIYSLSTNNTGYAFINLMEDELKAIDYNSYDSYGSYDKNELILSKSSYSQENNSIAKTLKAGKVYYLQFAYYKQNSNEVTETSKDAFDITLDLEYLDEIDSTETYPKYEGLLPKLNEEADTVQILRDISLNESLNIEKLRNVILDLNGYALTTNINDYTIKNDGILTIIDTKYNGEDSRGNINSTTSTVILNNETGTLNLTSGKLESNYIDGSAVENYGIITSKKETVINSKKYGIYNKSEKNVVLNDINIKTSTTGIYNESTGTIEISGGTINSSSYGMENGLTGVIIVSDGTITSNNNAILGRSGKVDITGGKIISNKGVGVSGSNINISSGTIQGTTGVSGSGTMNGGTVKATSSLSSDCGISSNGTFNILGGAIESSTYGICSDSNRIMNIGENGDIVNNSSPSIKSNIGIKKGEGIINYYDGVFTSSLNNSIEKGGTISKVPDNYDLDIQKSADNEVMTLSKPSDVASIDEQKYNTLQNAINSIEESNTQKTIKLLKDIYTVRQITNDKNIILDLNGYNIHTYLGDTYFVNNGVIELTNDKSTENIIESSKLTLANNDGMKINNVNITSYATAIDNNSTKDLLISNGTINAVIYGINNKSTGSIEISDEIITPSQKVPGMTDYGIYNNLNGTITLSGGTIDNFNYGIYNKSSGTIEISKGDINSQYYGINNESEGIVEMSGGTITITGRNNSSSGIRNVSGIIYLSGGEIKTPYNQQTGISNVSGTIEMSSGTINASTGIENGATGTIRMSGGIIQSSIYGIKNNTTGTIEMSNGKIIKTSYGIYNQAAGIIKMSNGEIKESQNGIYNNSTGTIEISGGTIDSSEYGIYNKVTGTINIGIQGEPVNIDLPDISGKKNGVYNASNGIVNFYDGVLRGPIDNSTYGKMQIEEGYSIYIEKNDDTESAYLKKENVAKIVSTGQEYYSLQAAINAVDDENQETIQLLRDFIVLDSEETINITKDKNIKLDLSNHSINSKKEILFKNNGIFEITNDGTIEAGISSSKLIENDGTLKISGGTYNNINIDSYIVFNNGTIEMSNGTMKIFNYGIYNNSIKTVKLSGGTIVGNLSNSYGIYNASTGTIEMSSGTISESRYGIYNASTGIIKMFGGEIKSSTDGIYNASTGTIEMSNGEIKDSQNGIYNKSSGIIEISGGTIQGEVYGSNINISGGTIQGEVYGSGTMTAGTVKSDSCGISSNGTFNILGGTIESSSFGICSTGTINIGVNDDVNNDSPLIKSNTGIQSYTTGIINYYDGTFISKNASIQVGSVISKVPDNYDINIEKTQSNETMTLSKSSNVASIDDQEYDTLQDAINSIEGNETQKTIKLLKDIYTVRQITNDKNIILDLNGHNIHSYLRGTYFVNNGVIEFINDKSTENIIESSQITLKNNEEIKIENVNITSNVSIAIDNYSIKKLLFSDGKITASTIGVQNNSSGTIEVSNGTIHASTGISNKKNGTIKLSGGTITSSSYGIHNASEGKVIMSEGEIKSNDTGIYNASTGTIEMSNGIIFSIYYGIHNFSTGKVIMSGGEIKNLSLVSRYGIYNNSTGVVEMSSGIISGSSYGIYNASEGKVIMSGGEIKTDDTGIYNESTGTIEMSEGEIKEFYKNGIQSLDGEVNITGGKIISDRGTGVSGSKINISSGTIQGATGLNGSGTMTGGKIIGTSSETSKCGINSTGTFNILGGTIESSSYGICSTGTVNIGEKGIPVDTSLPSITGEIYGINNTTGTVNFYDGSINGRQAAFSGEITVGEPGYKILLQDKDDMKNATLTLIGEEERVASVNGLNFKSLQEAINSAPDDVETNVILYTNITFTENIVVPERKIIKLYLNGHTLNKGEFDFVKNGTLDEIAEGLPTGILANITNLIKEALNIETNVKNIIVYEMEDGSSLSSDETYKLYKENNDNYELMKMKKEEEIGRYTIGNKEDEMRTVRGRLYINNLPTGNYKVVSSDNKEIQFSILEDGNIVGKIRNNINQEKSKVIATAIAELIITIQTGFVRSGYIVMAILILVIISLLFMVMKQRKNFE